MANRDECGSFLTHNHPSSSLPGSTIRERPVSRFGVGYETLENEEFSALPATKSNSQKSNRTPPDGHSESSSNGLIRLPTPPASYKPTVPVPSLKKLENGINGNKRESSPSRASFNLHKQHVFAQLFNLDRWTSKSSPNQGKRSVHGNNDPENIELHESPAPRIPYIVVGILNREGTVMNEVVLPITKEGSLFQVIKQASKLLRRFPCRFFSLKRVSGFDIYRSTPNGADAYLETVKLDTRSALALMRMWKDYKAGGRDHKDLWMLWVQKSLNDNGNCPERGKYGLSLKLSWSAMKFVYYGIFAVVISLATGLSISFGWKGPDMQFVDKVQLQQTAWTIASYIMTTAGGN
jgi:hypothetical protein